ncbi:nucleobase:cation symporter-2 family protein [Oenococcus alcoholitolerans]|uniref:nucleobase:cation symporter-2 family protein n=1 Tax=Oenococcus alcoholitolerans TaxID=931074 RepID=UPI003F7210D7
MSNKDKAIENYHSALLGIQHLLAMYSGAVLVPLLVGGALRFNPAQMTYLISIDIFMCGLATFLQLFTNKVFGIGLPVVLGCAIQAVAPLQMIGQRFSIGTMYGAIIASAFFVFLIAGTFAKIRKLFPPLVTGIVITVIGLTLIPIAFVNLGGGNAAAKNFGSADNLIVGLFTILVVLVCSIYGRGFIKRIAVLIGLLLGTVLASFMGMVSFDAVLSASWFHFPQPFYFGRPQFEISSILTMIAISLVSLVESTGVFFALGDITKRKIGEKDLKKGYRAEALAGLLGGIFNTFPYTTFSQNVSLVQLSGIKSRQPIYYAAGFLVLLGLLPKVGAMATIIPTPVIGGATVIMFGMIAIQGIRMLEQVNFANNKNILVAAISIGAGLGVSVEPNIFQSLPETVRLIFSNGVVVASLCAVVLNLIIRPDKETEEIKNPVENIKQQEN